MQGPQKMQPAIGTDGNWNSTVLPRWYFINSNVDVEYTRAEVRGGLDGLILSYQINELFTKWPSLRLSQVLDMYYSGRGLFYDRQYRACNRRTLLSSVAPNETMSAQADSSALLLNTALTEVTLTFDTIEKFATQAAQGLLTFIPSQLNGDLTCEQTDRADDHSQVSVDLTIVLDTNWPFESVQPILAHLLDNLEINQYNSNFTLINGHDGAFMINSTWDILDFFSFNASHYRNYTPGFDLPKTLETLNRLQLEKMNRERENGVGGARSNVILIIPYSSPFANADKEYCLQTIQRMREVMPDMTLLIATHGSKDTWSDLVANSNNDLFSISTGDTQQSLTPFDNIIARVKQVPKRLINSQCGGDYIVQGSSGAFDDYAEPDRIVFYKLHPNYFYNSDTTYVPKVKIQGSSSQPLTVCSSRELLHVNTTENRAAASCVTLRNDVHTIELSCTDASYIHECPPLYLAVAANNTNPTHQCIDPQVCRFQSMIKYTVSYENLVCVNSGGRLASNLTVLLILISYILYSSQ